MLASALPISMLLAALAAPVSGTNAGATTAPQTRDEGEKARPTATIEALRGRHRFVGGEAERRAWAKAIESTVAGLGPLARRIALDRLREGNRISEVIEIDRDGNAVVVVSNGRRFRAPMDGTAVKTTGHDGDPVTYRVRVRDGKLRQSFTTEDGSRADVLRRRGSDRIVLLVRVSSPRLPKSLEYRLTYARAPRK